MPRLGVDDCVVAESAYAAKIDKLSRHAEFLSKYPGDPCQTSLQLDKRGR